MIAERLFESLFAVSSDVRYVALRTGDHLAFRQRDGITDSSSSESDRYEELLVNPTLLTLVSERGKIDCGGLEFVIVRYGRFFQLVHPVKEGHVSIAIEASADPLDLASSIRDILNREGLWPVA